MAIISNSELLSLMKSDPTYKSWTSKATDDLFTSKGFEATNLASGHDIADFFALSVRIFLQQIRDPQIRIPKSFEKVVERFEMAHGGMPQRIRTYLIKPTNYRGRNLVQDGSIDPFVINKPKQPTEEFYHINWDFAINQTLQDVDFKKMFLDDSGITQFISKMMYAFDQANNIQEYAKIKEMIHLILTSTNNPLKTDQKQTLPNIMETTATEDDMREWIQCFKNLYDVMDNTVYSGQFNSKGYEHGTDPRNYVLYVRSNILNKIETTIMTTAFHIESLGIRFEVVPVLDFGGITYKDGTTDVLPVYSTKAGNTGEVLGFNASGTEDGNYKQPNELTKVDPHEDVQALLMQKGVLMLGTQNGYKTDVIYDPAGDYTNFWAKQPNKLIGYDASYDVVEFING